MGEKRTRRSRSRLGSSRRRGPAQARRGRGKPARAQEVSAESSTLPADPEAAAGPGTLGVPEAPLSWTAEGSFVPPTGGSVPDPSATADLPEGPAASQPADAPAEAATTEPASGSVLIVGAGDEARGDGGIGIHLMHCLAQMHWPEGVVFCRADESVPQRAEQFGRVIILDSLEGPESPGSLYRADPEELLRRSLGDEECRLGLLSMIPRSVRRRTAVFGVQPGTTSWGSQPSPEVIGALPLLLAYLRTVILSAAAELNDVH